MSDRDMIGATPVPEHSTDDTGARRFDLPDWGRDELRARFQLAQQEIDQLTAALAENPTRETLNRKALLVDYQKALTGEFRALVEAEASAGETVEFPDEAEILADRAPAPAEAEAEVEVPDSPEALETVETDVETEDREPVLAGVTEVGDVRIDAAPTAVDPDGDLRATAKVVTVPADQRAAALPADAVRAVSAGLTAGRTDGPVKVEVVGAPSGGVSRLWDWAGRARPKTIEVAPAAMLGALGPGISATGDLATNNGPIDSATVGRQIDALARRPVNGATSTYVWRKDRAAQLAQHGIERLPEGNLSAESPILAAHRRNAEAMLAALCGPGELSRDVNVCCTSERPLASAFPSPIMVGMGVHEFFRGLSLNDVYGAGGDLANLGGVGIWDQTDQAAVDPTDPSTWKECAVLPDCQQELCVNTYFLYRCLKVGIDDQLSRPQYIDAIASVMECLLARIAETAILEGIDGWSYDRVVPAVTGYGALHEMIYAIERTLAWATGQSRMDRTGYTAIVPEPLISALRADALFAGEDPDTVGEMLMNLGVDILVTPDWGAEGNAFPPLPPSPYPGGPVDPGAGTAIPALLTSYTVRLVPLDDFQWGSVGVEDFGLDTSPELKRQNCAMFFGETAEIFYKTGCRPSFSLTMNDVCPNGARADRVEPFTCAPTANDGTITVDLPAGWPAGQSC
jgi:hypothetical protein